MAVSFHEVVELGAENKFLPAPLTIGEIVIEKTYEGDQKYIRVSHNLGKSNSVFFRRHFKPYLPKDKHETLELIKNKGRKPKVDEKG